MKFFILIVTVLTLLAELAAAQWKNIAPNLLIKDNPRLPQHGALGAMTYSKGRVWLGYTNGLWMSSDDGKTWNKITSPVPQGDLIADIDFFDATNGLICTGGRLAKQYEYFLTRDGGVTWTSLPPMSTSLPLQSKFAGDPQRIVLSDIDANITLSTDGGLTFRTILKKDSVTQLHCIQTRGNTISALLLIGDNKGARIYTTTNDGLTWTIGRGFFGADSYSFALDSCNDQLVYVTNENYHSSSAGRLLYSRDAADSFTETEVHSNTYYSGSIVTSEGGAVYAQTRSGDGVLRSTDGGVTWKSIGGPPGIVDARMLSVKDDNTIFAVDSSGSVWATFNSGGDSLVLPFGANLITGVRAISGGLAKIAPTDTTHVRVRLDFVPGSDVTKLLADSITYMLKFRNTSIAPAFANMASNVIVPLGWNFVRGAVMNDTVLVTLRNTGGTMLETLQDLGTFIFRANANPDVLSSTIFVEQFLVHTSCRMYTSRMTTEADFVKSISISQSDVEEAKPEFLSIYPNPAQDMVTVESSRDLGQVTIEITNDLGEQIIKLNIYLGRRYSMDLQDVRSGSYTMIVTGKDLHETRSLIITR